jgi:hypothetical protein
VTRLRRDATSIVWLGRYVPPTQAPHIARFQLDQRAAALGTLSNVLWLRGFPDQAVSAAQSALEDLQATGHSLSLCNALVHTACPIALWVGDLPSAERFLAMLRDHLRKRRMTVMNPLCSCLAGVLLVNQGNFTGLELIQTALNKLREARFHMRFPAYLAVLAHGLSANG